MSFSDYRSPTNSRNRSVASPSFNSANGVPLTSPTRIRTTTSPLVTVRATPPAPSIQEVATNPITTINHQLGALTINPGTFTLDTLTEQKAREAKAAEAAKNKRAKDLATGKEQPRQTSREDYEEDLREIQRGHELIKQEQLEQQQKIVEARGLTIGKSAKLRDSTKRTEFALEMTSPIIMVPFQGGYPVEYPSKLETGTANARTLEQNFRVSARNYRAVPIIAAYYTALTNIFQKERPLLQAMLSDPSNANAQDAVRDVPYNRSKDHATAIDKLVDDVEPYSKTISEQTKWLESMTRGSGIPSILQGSSSPRSIHRLLDESSQAVTLALAATNILYAENGTGLQPNSQTIHDAISQYSIGNSSLTSNMQKATQALTKFKGDLVAKAQSSVTKAVANVDKTMTSAPNTPDGVAIKANLANSKKAFEEAGQITVTDRRSLDRYYDRYKDGQYLLNAASAQILKLKNPENIETIEADMSHIKADIREIKSEFRDAGVNPHSSNRLTRRNTGDAPERLKGKKKDLKKLHYEFQVHQAIGDRLDGIIGARNLGESEQQLKELNILNKLKNYIQDDNNYNSSGELNIQGFFREHFARPNSLTASIGRRLDSANRYYTRDVDDLNVAN